MTAELNINHKVQQVIDAYNDLGNVWKVGELLGYSGQHVHWLLTKLGVIHKMNYFTDEDTKFLKENYPIYRENRNLDELAKILGRTKQFICRKAKTLGLTDMHNRPPLKEDEKIAQSNRIKILLKENGHPKGFLGKHHTLQTKQKISDSSKRSWSNPNSKFHSDAIKQLRSDNMMKNRANGKIKSTSNRRIITATFEDKSFLFKSSWEYNIALILQQMKEASKIDHWDYEPKRFIFNDLKRGIRSYLPDFSVTTPKGTFYIEVKGWKMERSMRAISLFKERFPNEKLYILDEYEYRKIKSDPSYLWRYTEQIEWL